MPPLTDNDMLLVNYVGGKTKNLTAQEVRASLARCEVTLDFPIPPITEEKPIVKAARRTGTKSGSPAQYEATLLDLIKAGLLQPPVSLEREYKGKLLTARIEKDGRVQFGKDVFDSLSTAAGAARATVVGLRTDGRYPHTNGWSFWRMQGPGGRPMPVDDARQRYLTKGVQRRRVDRLQPEPVPSGLPVRRRRSRRNSRSTEPPKSL